MNDVKNAISYWCDDTVLGKYTGKKISVAILDTGIVAHPDFDGRIKKFIDCINGRQGLYDDSGHGTHVAGILAGSGSMSAKFYRGMAPEADIIAIKILDQHGDGAISGILKGVQWLLTYHRQFNIRIVNISAGAKDNLDENKSKELENAVERLWDAGLIVVVSAGNYGPEQGTVSVPGTSKKIITVGSSDVLLSAKQMDRNYYSGCGPTKGCVVKPDLIAPGYHIISCNSKYSNKENSPYVRKSGSSMSTPIVSGAIALALSKHPTMSNVEVKFRLRECCDAIKVIKQSQGWGQINVTKLLKDKERR